MASDENELEESRERLAERARWHLKEADAKRASDANGARRHDEIADELIGRICAERQVLGKAEAYARKAFGSKLELAEEVVVEAIFRLDRALRNYTTRLGLEQMFDATFHGIVVDAIRHVERTNRHMMEGPKDKLDIVSLDAPHDECEEGATFADLREDRSAVHAYFEVIDRNAFDSIASRMKPRQLQVIKMRAEGHGFIEIAKALGINRDTASADYDKALEFIKNNITPPQGGESK